MPKRSKQIPDNFESYEEAAEFWDAHDSTDFINFGTHTIVQTL
jgi:hypothetical protein